MKKLVDKFIDIMHGILEKVGENRFYKILIFFFLACALAQIFVPGLPHGDDLYFHLSRVEGITDGLKNGVFPVLIYPGYLSGYGYANGIFYPDIFLYIPAFLHYFGLSTIVSCKVLMFFVIIGIFASMYLTVKKITKSNFTATIISILYLMSSYRITDMWIRFALGETLTFVFLPLIILGLYEIIYGNEKNWKYLTIGLVGVVLSHLLSGLFCIIVVGIFGLCNLKKLWKEKSRLKYALIGGFLAIGITLFFTAPLLEAMLSDNFVYQNYSDGSLIAKRSANPLITILEIPSRVRPWVPQGVGIVFVYLFLRFIKVKVDDKEQKKFKNICIISGIVCWFASTSLFPWNVFGKLLGMLQFPWRFYILVTVFLLLGFSVLINKESRDSKKRIGIMLVLSVFAMFTFAVGSYYTIRHEQYKEIKKYHITWGEYVPLDVDIKKYEERGEIITSNHDIEIVFDKKGTNMDITYKNNHAEDTYIELPLLYYKGYIALNEDGEHLKISKGENGMIRVTLDKEMDNIHIEYGITIVRKISLVLSVVSLVCFALLCIKWGKNKL